MTAAPEADADDGLYADQRRIFAMFDKSQDGTMPVAQLGTALRGCGLCPTEKELQEVLAKWAEQPEAVATFDDFVAAFEALSNEKTAALARDAFFEGLQHFDQEGTGKVKVDELRHVLTSIGEKLTPEEADQLFAGLGDENGMLGIDEFVRLVTQ